MPVVADLEVIRAISSMRAATADSVLNEYIFTSVALPGLNSFRSELQKNHHLFVRKLNNQH